MIINVRMLSSHENSLIRQVSVPDKKWNATADLLDHGQSNCLDLVYYYGQNDIQPVKDRCSVSVGDVIEIAEGNYVVSSVGFVKFTDEEYAAYKNASRDDRWFLARGLQISA